MTDSDYSEDYSAAAPLEVPVETAERAEAILRDFADDAELDMALIVDQSGMLIAGITANEDISTDIISALAAGANGAVQALAGEVGEESSVESIHQGENRCLYFRGLADRFVLVGTADSDIPAGIIREKAAQIKEELTAVLQEIREAPIPPKPRRRLHSMQRQVAPPPLMEEEEEDLEADPVLFETEESDGEFPADLPPAPEEAAPVQVEYAWEELQAFAEEEESEPIALPPIPASDWEDEKEEEETIVSEEQEEDDETFPAAGTEEEELEVEWEQASVVEEVEEEVVDEIEGEQEEPDELEEAPVRKSSPPVLVSPVVVDSPFEAVDDEEEEGDALLSHEEQEQHPDPPEAPEMKAPPVSKSGESEDDQEGSDGEKRKPGPRYSFELG